jgi:hypothetical protein
MGGVAEYRDDYGASHPTVGGGTVSAVRKESAAADNKLLRAAVALAEKGKPVFPCSPSNKRPITTNGFKDATTNIQQISDWWRKNPDALIGMPTGAITGVSVVDVDLGKVGHSLRDTVARDLWVRCLDLR